MWVQRKADRIAALKIFQTTDYIKNTTLLHKHKQKQTSMTGTALSLSSADCIKRSLPTSPAISSFAVNDMSLIVAKGQ